MCAFSMEPLRTSLLRWVRCLFPLQSPLCPGNVTIWLKFFRKQVIIIILLSDIHACTLTFRCNLRDRSIFSLSVLEERFQKKEHQEYKAAEQFLSLLNSQQADDHQTFPKRNRALGFRSRPSWERFIDPPGIPGRAAADQEKDSVQGGL